MKTTIEVSDALLRQAKATAALRGESLRQLFEEALSDHLAGAKVPTGGEGWRRVFGRAERAAVEEVDAAVAAELGRIEPESWR
jgi:hypothetical protein